eukprot:5522468-Pleurochrysis_carterae.AAC.4
MIISTTVDVRTSSRRQVVARSGYRDEFRTWTNRPARAPCCHRHFCASESIQNNFKGHVLLPFRCSGRHCSTHLAVDKPCSSCRMPVVPSWPETSPEMILAPARTAPVTGSAAAPALVLSIQRTVLSRQCCGQSVDSASQCSVALMTRSAI